MSAQDPELSAALGWPGGISDPVLDRTLLLQMVAALRLASQQALEALEMYRKMMFVEAGCRFGEGDAVITALRAALRAVLAQQAEPARGWVSMDEYKRLQGLVTSQGIRLMEYESKQPQQAEPVEPVVWDVTKNGRLIYDYDFTHDVSLRVMGDFEDDEQRVRYAKQIVDKLNAAPAQQAEPVAWRSENANPPGGYVIFQQYPQALADLGKPIQPLYTAPPQRKLVPLTAQELDGVIERHVGGSEITDDMYTSMEQFARAVEKASWEKNSG